MGSKAKASPVVDDRWEKVGCEVANGHKGVSDDAVGEGQEFVVEDTQRIEEHVDGIDGLGCGASSIQGSVQNLSQLPSASFSQQQQQRQLQPVSVVRWERFLPLRSLKVLLVENDDSTRHVVSALLRNCSYEVTTAANGLDAWRIMEGFNNNVDLVLTEVAMPGLSGFGLLCKIMSHMTCKNIPVIMMSSHDSMGIVVKCLSKGAVDFLVKPIRKNELKNLWQHVWRRCHSSSGSGSESGIQANKSARSMSVDESDNNSMSSDEDDDSSIGLNMRDGSDNGSGTQSFWTKQADEIESPKPASQQDIQFAEPHDSTCAQVIHPKSETFCNEWLPNSDDEDYTEKKTFDDESMGKDLRIGVPKDTHLEVENFPSQKFQASITNSSLEFATEETTKNNKQPCLLEQESLKITSVAISQAADTIRAVADANDIQIPSKSNKVSNDMPNISGSKGKAVYDAMELPSIKLGLSRQISAGDGVATTISDRNILRHSDQSAFSRYNISMASNQTPTALGGTNDSNHINMGLTVLNACSRPPPLTAKPVNGKHFSGFHPVHQQPSGTEVLQEKAVDVEASATVVQPKGIRVQVEHHHHHYHHHHIHGVQHSPQVQPPGEQEQYTLKNMPSAIPQCGSSNVFSRPIECNAANYSINGSVTGSNHGSNAPNISCAAADTVGINTEDSAAAGKSRGEDNNGSGMRSDNAVDCNRVALREAALNKFRQKRKERCFEKKVRYQSRKKLAEQRPRVRGQFVRQTMSEQDGNC